MWFLEEIRKEAAEQLEYTIHWTQHQKTVFYKWNNNVCLHKVYIGVRKEWDNDWTEEEEKEIVRMIIEEFKKQTAKLNLRWILTYLETEWQPEDEYEDEDDDEPMEMDHDDYYVKYVFDISKMPKRRQ